MTTPDQILPPPAAGGRRVRLPISLKITFPYIALALIIVLAAGLVATWLVFENINARFENDLLTARKIVSDLMVSKENDLLAVLRSISFTSGVAERLAEADSEALRTLILPIVANAAVSVDVVDASGLGVLALYRPSNGNLQDFQFSKGSRVYQTWNFVARALKQSVDLNNDRLSNKYAGWGRGNGGVYFYVTGPVYTPDGRFAGVVLVGISLEDLADEFEREIGAQAVTFYDLDGQPLRSSYSAPDLFAEQAGLAPGLASAIRAETQVQLRQLTVGSVAMAEALGIWQARNGEHLGLMGVARATQQNPEGQEQLPLIFGVIAGLLVLVIFVGLFVARQITRPLQNVVTGIDQVDRGNFDVTIPAHSDDEIAVLATAFNAMVGGLRAKVRMEGELNFARQIQMSLLPSKFPAFPNRPEVEVYAALQPAREVGGDFYDFFFVDERRLFFVIGDVSGKSAAAALFMAVVKTLIKAWAGKEPSPARVLQQVNDEISRDNKKMMFVTIFMGVLDVRTGELVYTNAAHNPPYLQHADGGLERLDSRHGPIVGPKRGVAYQEARARVRPGDLLFMYTDGVTEAMDPAEQLYSETRMVAEVLSQPQVSATLVVQQTMDRVQAYMNGAAQADDITVLAVRYQGRAPAHFRLDLDSRLAEIERAADAFDRFADEQELPAEVRRVFQIALDELLNNSISYGYRGEAGHPIEIRVELEAEHVRLIVADAATPFDPLARSAPDTRAGLHQRQAGGLGIHLVRTLMDRTDYQYVDQRNVITLEKSLGVDKP